ncbi:MAG: hypothetical protein ACAH59_03970 [Pseudobdellovibrionaceae bacterium]
MRFFLALLLLPLVACHSSRSSSFNESPAEQAQLYSLDGSERQVQFQAILKSSEKSLETLSPTRVRYEIKDLIPFLYGPLTTRQWGAPQKGEQIEILTQQAFVQDGVVMVPYIYRGTWLIGKKLLAAPFFLPVPFSTGLLDTPQWNQCTDSHEGHNGWDMFWYYWDPTRWGCDHREGVNFQTVQIQMNPQETPQTFLSFPEYRKMIRMEGQQPVVSMSFAFGYVEDPEVPRPFTDRDAGMIEFQRFHQLLRSVLLPMGFQENPVLQKAFDDLGEERIGTRFVGWKNGVLYRIHVLAAAGVDQMDLFAHSYAKEHESFFAWFGHSRVGSGFDAQRFHQIVSNNPEIFSLTSDYQLVYWAGCNSYSYYTAPFFEMKASLQPDVDPRGSKSLDIISNGLPSLFAFNTDNAEILFRALFNPESPTSYQALVNQLEAKAHSWGYEVLVNVLGDEDNE